MASSRIHFIVIMATLALCGPNLSTSALPGLPCAATLSPLLTPTLRSASSIPYTSDLPSPTPTTTLYPSASALTTHLLIPFSPPFPPFLSNLPRRPITASSQHSASAIPLIIISDLPPPPPFFSAALERTCWAVHNATVSAHFRDRCLITIVQLLTLLCGLGHSELHRIMAREHRQHRVMCKKVCLSPLFFLHFSLFFHAYL
ncbi:hypothetical protein M427DRAFT_408290 [Gonapodya prolifera JEL478]|uniref:Uncharacterized protein n=1 Tax=Gonapodya prolifera (strain JEL478) TaxID=1344416 RepID=A0A139A753_GONPJ|nr:hypothetical protein M427DRAFT_408290 [Gonapodya prolifera JEL478]|eukprot:KXS12173.1 hypothetical protein M427DRAFT_408290 [Gonapodya prolifera JEL478]